MIRFLVHCNRVDGSNAHFLLLPCLFIVIFIVSLYCRYSKIPDNLVPLTELGWEQARQAGRRLRNDILKASSSSITTFSSSSLTVPPPRQVHFIVSPYVRTVETFHGIVSAWCDPSEFSHIPNRDERIKAWYSKLLDMGISWAEDPRIREQVRSLFPLFQQVAPQRKCHHTIFVLICCATPFRILETCKIQKRLSNPNKSE
jgi:hypothetical protein